VETAQEAFQSRPRMPWYDQRADSIKPVDVQTPEDETQRDSDWNRQDKSARDTNVQQSQRGASDAWGVMLRVAAWLLLAAVLVAIVLFLASAALRIDGGETASPGVIRKSDADRVENLPFAVPSAESDFLAAARRNYDAGDFDTAIIYLFSSQLVELDRRHFIRLARGKTNRQYLRELRSRPELRAILARTVLEFEEVFFGHHSLSRARFDECWQQLDRFHDLVRQDAA
jgi:hypothetical protein